MPLFVAWFGCLVNRFEKTARPAAASKCRSGWESGVESQVCYHKTPRSLWLGGGAGGVIWMACGSGHGLLGPGRLLAPSSRLQWVCLWPL